LLTLASELALERARVVICDTLEHRASLVHCNASAMIVDASIAPYSNYSDGDWLSFVEEQARANRPVCWLLPKTDRDRTRSLSQLLLERSIPCEVLGFDDRAPLPLRELNVAVTRPRAQQKTLSRLLRAMGAESWDFAAIEVRAAPDPAVLRSAVDRVGSAQVLAFTSANGVDAFFDALAERSKDARALAGVVVASIGAATSARLRERGVIADLCAREAVGESLAQSILERLGDRAHGAKVMVVRAVRGRATLVEALRAAGVEVDLVLAYETAPSSTLGALRAALEQGAIDVMTFASGSAIDAVLETLGSDARQLLAPVTIATVGPVTTAHAQSVGLSVPVQAAKPSDEALVEALCAHFVRVRGR
jgi:uroporphyrinogen III methyltransferase/synthase